MTHATSPFSALKPISGLFVILVLSLSSGCGQKGDLYIPKTDLPEAQTTQTSETASQETKKKAQSASSND